MDLVLVALTWEICLVYHDDVIIMSETFVEHLARVGIVFDQLRAANLKLKVQTYKKYKLFWREVVFLGHLFTGNGIALGPPKV